MATLSKHGKELLRLEYAQSRLAYMSDGQIMRNQGQGWKLYKRVKPGINVAEHAEYVAEKRKIRDAACPSYARYITLLCELCCLEQRWKVHNAIMLMGNDIDGVWSTLDDEYDCRGFSLDDIKELCECYELGQAELKTFKASLVQAAPALAD